MNCDCDCVNSTLSVRLLALRVRTSIAPSHGISKQPCLPDTTTAAQKRKVSEISGSQHEHAAHHAATVVPQNAIAALRPKQVETARCFRVQHRRPFLAAAWRQVIWSEEPHGGLEAEKHYPCPRAGRAKSGEALLARAGMCVE